MGGLGREDGHRYETQLGGEIGYRVHCLFRWLVKEPERKGTSASGANVRLAEVAAGERVWSTQEKSRFPLGRGSGVPAGAGSFPCSDNPAELVLGRHWGRRKPVEGNCD